MQLELKKISLFIRERLNSEFWPPRRFLGRLRLVVNTSPCLLDDPRWFFCIMLLPPAPGIKNIYIHYIMRVVGVWYGINIVCIGHFTPPVDLSDGPFKKWAAVHANKEETTLLIYLKSTGRYHRPIAYMFSFCWQWGVFFFGALYMQSVLNISCLDRGWYRGWYRGWLKNTWTEEKKDAHFDEN